MINLPVGVSPESAQALPDGEARELRVLLIEDSEADTELTLRRFKAAGFRCSFRCVSGESEMRRELEAALPDVILSDFGIPGFNGMTALAIARAEAPGVPFIFLSGTIGEERAIEALKRGAIDYVLKSNPARLIPAVNRALADAALRRTSLVAELRVTRLSGVLQMLSGINAALLRIQNRGDLLHETCRLARHVGGYTIAMVALIDPITRMARAMGWAGYEFLSQPDDEFPVADHEGADQSLLGRVIRTGKMTLCEDIHRSPYVIDGKDALIAVGVRSLACFPLRIDGTPVGSFLCGTSAVDGIGPEEILLLEEVAANLSFALQYLDKQDAVQFLSYFEPLTGLAKRGLFCERLNRLLKSGSTSLQSLAVAVFDIEHLSVINDSLGRHTGDRLLQCVAERLKGHFSDTEQLAHLGGGTFVARSTSHEQGGDAARLWHRAFEQLFSRPFDVDGHSIVATIKSGMACFPQDGREPQELVQNAEAALKEAKAGGVQYLHHRFEMNSELARRVGMEHRLRSALADEQFVLHYQPKITLRTGRIAGVEALVRWQDPESGLVAPGVFLPLLESAGLMGAMGAWVLKRAASDCREWQRMGLPPVRIAVNLSPSELRAVHAAREILECIGDVGVDSGWGIDIEITEGALAGDSATCVQALRSLRAAGMRIAIDDFGTGFSSLGRLSELPIDTLKIDRSFTMRLPDDVKGCTLVSTIVGLAHAFDMSTVAEGVETPAQLKYLIEAGCDESQGYLHSRPIAKDEFEQLIRP